MRLLAVAVDYDGTLATDGVVDPDTIRVVEQFVASGRKLLLVTGRILKELLVVFPQAHLCTSIVAENGAVLYDPSTQTHRLLGSPAPKPFIEALARRKVDPLVVGESIVATLRPHEVAALETIRDLGLEHHVVFNRESVMILPSGINKATGLKAALRELGLSPHNVVAIGDSENDHALLDAAEYGVAVRNAIPQLQETADLVTDGEAGAGVSEIMRALMHDDLALLPAKRTPGEVRLGWLRDDRPLCIPAAGENILLAGPRPDMTVLVTALFKNLASEGYQCCLIDPDGEYRALPGAVLFGNPQHSPTMAEIMTAMANPDTHTIVNLAGLPPHGRLSAVLELLRRLKEWQQQVGRPHRMFLHDSDLLFPRDWQPSSSAPWCPQTGMVYCAASPERLANALLQTVTLAIALGAEAESRLQSYAERAGLPWTPWTGPKVMTGEGLVWTAGQAMEKFKVAVGEGDANPRE